MMGRGFALVPTPLCPGDHLLKELKGARTAPRPGSKRWSRFPHLHRYRCWLERLLVQALPEETLRLVDLDVRHEPAGSANPLVDKLHADGLYVRSVWTLYGPTTIYRDGRAEPLRPARPNFVDDGHGPRKGTRSALHAPPPSRRGTGTSRDRVLVCEFTTIGVICPKLGARPIRPDGRALDPIHRRHASARRSVSEKHPWRSTFQPNDEPQRRQPPITAAAHLAPADHSGPASRPAVLAKPRPSGYGSRPSGTASSSPGRWRVDWRSFGTPSWGT